MEGWESGPTERRAGSSPCAYHPRRRAVAVCVRCGEAVCPECLRVEDEGALCPHCSGSGEPVPAEISWDDAESGTTASGKRAAAAGVCAYHAGRPAVEVCSICSTALCRQCLREGSAGALCPDCHTLHSPADGRRSNTARPLERSSPLASVRIGSAEAAEERVSLSPWAGVCFLPFPLMLMLLVTWLVNRGEGFGWGTSVLMISILLYGGLIFFVALQLRGASRPLLILGFRRDGLALSLAGGTLAGLAAFGVNFALLSLSMRLMESWNWLDRWLRGLMELKAYDASGGWDLAATVAVVLILAPLCEEVFFRGYLYAAMRGRLDPLYAVLLNGFLFSLVHFSLYGVPGRLALGVALCLLYEHTGNLATPLAAHAVNNLLALLLPMLSR